MANFTTLPSGLQKLTATPSGDAGIVLNANFALLDSFIADAVNAADGSVPYVLDGELAIDAGATTDGSGAWTFTSVSTNTLTSTHSTIDTLVGLLLHGNSIWLSDESGTGGGNVYLEGGQIVAQGTGGSAFLQAGTFNDPAGISMVCADSFELNFAGGVLRNYDQNTSSVVPIVLGSVLALDTSSTATITASVGVVSVTGTWPFATSDQALNTTSDVTFNSVIADISGCTGTPNPFDQNLNTTSIAVFGGITLNGDITLRGNNLILSNTTNIVDDGSGGILITTTGGEPVTCITGPFVGSFSGDGTGLTGDPALDATNMTGSPAFATISATTLAIGGALADGTYPCGTLGSITITNGVITAIS